MDKTIDDKLMYISIDNTQNYPFFRLKVVAVKFGPNKSKVPKLYGYKTLGTSVIYSPMSPHSLVNIVKVNCLPVLKDYSGTQTFINNLSIRGLKYFGYFWILNLIKVYKLFHLFFGRGNFVYHHRGSTSIFRPLSYPFRSRNIVQYLHCTNW